ncbi:PREDICTED: doublesex- and mab-3-related transcription factor B1, partial [Acanthisitta chloris]|uniref:doublesex- and mab-3-related transcription factor B1 n=1 Tax=Acanthisitta chloris TaxID=57068 RepID=UPI0004F0CA61
PGGAMGTVCQGPPPAPSAPPCWDYAHSACAPEYVVSPEYLEREAPQVYPGCSGVYPYRPYPIGFASNESGCRQAPSPPGVSLQRGFGHFPSNYGPGNAAPVPVPDGGGDFHQGYCTVPQFIPPSFLTGIHYIPPPVAPNILAEAAKEARAIEVDSEDPRVVCEPAQPPSSTEETSRNQPIHSKQ